MQRLLYVLRGYFIYQHVFFPFPRAVIEFKAFQPSFRLIFKLSLTFWVLPKIELGFLIFPLLVLEELLSQYAQYNIILILC